MADREKVIKGLNNIGREIVNTIGHGEAVPYLRTIDDAIALLKQEAVEPFHKCIGKHFSLVEDSNYDYCPYCGKRISWEKQEGR